MSVDKPEETNVIKGDSGGRTEHVNGVQNGYTSSDKYKSSHKSSSKDKHRDKDRDHKSSSSSKHHSSSGSSSKDKDKDRHSSSKSSSHKSSNRDKERSEGERDKSKSDKDHKSSKSGDSSKDKERSEKHKSSSSSHDKDKKHSSSSSSKEKTSSSGSSRDKSSSSSSKDKHRSEKDKERNDKDRDKERDRHHSSKDKHSSSSKDKSKSSHDKSRDKSSHSSSKDKHNSSSHKSSSPEKKEIKIEVNYHEDLGNSFSKINTIKNEDIDVEDDYAEDPLATTVSSCDYSLSQFKDEPLDARMDVDSEEDVPLSARKAIKRESNFSESEEEKPLSARKKPKIEKKKIKEESDYDDDYSEDEPPKKKKAKVATKPAKTAKSGGGAKKVDTSANNSSPKKRKKDEEEQEVWKWWEEEKKDDGTKWKFLEHKGPLFAPDYEPLPKNVIFKYDGKVVHLSEEAEEVAGFYAKMLDHDYTTKKVFNDNFFNDWRKVMDDEEKSIIKNLSKCDFRQMHAFFKEQSERNKNKTKEEKQAIKLKNEEIQKEYGFCKIDGHKEKIGNFRIEPPGLFRGRGEHPKMGKLKQRVLPEHIIINCSKDSKAPKAPDGHKWKEVRHDNTVTWLASWTENVQGQVKYIMLNPSSKLKGEKDWQKYETARKLAKSIDKIRSTYREEWKAKEMRIRQRAVALYFIDRLALRAGNEKDEDQADTVGCCSLRVEHIELHKEKDGREYVVVFDFLGKDSIRYYNEVPVEKRVFKNLELFKENKKSGDDLFDRLNTQIMNEHLRELMPNLTAKVFRTFNASFTLQNQLNELTDSDSTIEEKILAYNRANRAVAVLCNHQRAVPKGHQKSMDALKEKIQAKRDQIDDAEADLKDAVKQAKKGSVKEKLNADKKKKALEKLRDQLRKLEVQETDRDENKTIALGTSKLNYLDPRISIAWCKKNGVPIEKIYNKTQRDKFRWAIDMATVDYVF